MNLKELSESQRSAFLDLATLAMYVDGHLAGVEDKRIVHLLESMGYESEYDQARQLDAAVSRVSGHSGNLDSARSYVQLCAKAFNTHAEKQWVSQVLQEIVSSDHHITGRENSYLNIVQDSLR